MCADRGPMSRPRLLHNTDWSTEDDEVHRVNVGVNVLLRARRELPDLE